jgi:hypothetical protein
VTPDEKLVKTVIVGVGNKKMIQEDRDPKTRKLLGITTHEVDDNDQLIAVSTKNLEIKLNLNQFNFR